jgi:thiamine biosynthesis lipoprotein
MSAIKRCRPLLGTFVEISLADPDLPERDLEDMADLAFGRIARVQSLMSFHDPSSELSRLNACGHLHPLPVNEWTREVIGEAVRLSRVSEGIFDIASSSETDEPLQGNFRDIVMHRDGRVSFRRKVSLDLSVISRGYAVDKAADLLAAQNVHQATINAGGDIRFVGARPSNLSIGDPVSSQQVQLHAQVTGPAVSTTSACISNRRHHWKRVSDILHPRTLKPMKSNVSVSVFANTCVQADALAWVVLLDEPQSWQSLLAKEKASAVFVTAKGEMVRFPAAA